MNMVRKALTVALLGVASVAMAQSVIHTSRGMVVTQDPPAAPPAIVSTTSTSPLAPTPASPAAVQAAPALRWGRVSVFSGAAQAWDLEQRAWAPLYLNRAVTVGDRIRTEPGARVEIQIGAVEVSIAPGSDVEFPALEASRLLVRLASGSLALIVRHPEAVQGLEVLTDDLRLQPLGVGLMRIDRDRRVARSAAQVLQGLARLTHPGQPMDLRAGQRLEVTAADGVPRMIASEDPEDPWSVSIRSLAAQTPGPLAPPIDTAVPADMTGAEILTRHGRWEQHPEHGPVWWPTAVRSDWEPFRHGRWVWVRPGGWVWWEDAPWGFAPYHYGQWVIWGNRWVWAPRLHHRPPPRVVVPPPLIGTRPPPASAPVVPPIVHPVVPPALQPGHRPHPVVTPVAPPVHRGPGWRHPDEDRSMRTPRLREEMREPGHRELQPRSPREERPDRPDRAERPQRPDRPERPERPERRERDRRAVE